VVVSGDYDQLLHSREIECARASMQGDGALGL
jgi:hypothetical protein